MVYERALKGIPPQSFWPTRFKIWNAWQAMSPEKRSDWLESPEDSPFNAFERAFFEHFIAGKASWPVWKDGEPTLKMIEFLRSRRPQGIKDLTPRPSFPRAWIF